MKKILLSTAIVLICGIFAQAQDNAITKHFSTWQNDARFTKVTVSPAMFDLFEHLEGETQEEKELIAAVEKIEGMSVLSCDNCGTPKEMYNTATSSVSKRFEELMLIQDGDVTVNILIRENSGIVQELLFAVADETSFTLVDIWGEVDLKQVMKITKTFANSELPEIEPNKLENARKVKLYPNPVQSGQNMNVTVAREMLGMEYVIHDLSGKEKKRMRIDSESFSFSTLGLAQGQYILSIWGVNGKESSFSFSII